MFYPVGLYGEQMWLGVCSPNKDLNSRCLAYQEFVIWAPIMLAQWSNVWNKNRHEDFLNALLLYL